jgi:transposase
MDCLEKQKAELESTMESLSQDFSRQIELLVSAPGIDIISAMTIISEIGVDMNVFGSVKKFLSWVGLVPQNNESAGKKHSTRIGKGNHWLKPVIIQCANAAKNAKNHPEIRNKYLALKKRRGYGKAIVAIAKRIMTAVYYMLLRDETYNPQNCLERAPARGKIQLHNLINYYNSKGYVVVTEDGEVLQTA